MTYNIRLVKDKTPLTWCIMADWFVRYIKEKNKGDMLEDKDINQGLYHRFDNERAAITLSKLRKLERDYCFTATSNMLDKKYRLAHRYKQSIYYIAIIFDTEADEAAFMMMFSDGIDI